MKLPIQSQPIMRKVGTAKIDDRMPGVTASRTWACWYRDHDYKGTVEVWWSNDRGAGTWACNEWKTGWLGCDGECTAYD